MLAFVKTKFLFGKKLIVIRYIANYLLNVFKIMIINLFNWLKKSLKNWCRRRKLIRSFLSQQWFGDNFRLFVYILSSVFALTSVEYCKMNLYCTSWQQPISWLITMHQVNYSCNPRTLLVDVARDWCSFLYAFLISLLILSDKLYLHSHMCSMLHLLHVCPILIQYYLFCNYSCSRL